MPARAKGNLPLARALRKPLTREERHTASGQCAGAPEDGAQHRLRQLAGEGVLLAGVVRAEQRDALVERASRRRGRSAGAGAGTARPAADQARRKPSMAIWPRATTTRRPPSRRQLLEQVRPAVDDLVRQRLVGRRRAAADRRHEGAAQREAVAAVDRGRLVGEAGRVQRLEQEVAAAVAGEQAPGAIAAVRRRRQPDDQQRRARGRRNPAAGGPSTSWSRYWRRLTRATASRCATRRGQSRQAMMVRSSRSQASMTGHRGSCRCPLPVVRRCRRATDNGQRQRHICFHTLARLSPCTDEVPLVEPAERRDVGRVAGLAQALGEAGQQRVRRLRRGALAAEMGEGMQDDGAQVALVGQPLEMLQRLAEDRRVALGIGIGDARRARTRRPRRAPRPPPRAPARRAACARRASTRSAWPGSRGAAWTSSVVRCPLSVVGAVVRRTERTTANGQRPSAAAVTSPRPRTSGTPSAPRSGGRS